jgi:hypothetical protein
MDNLTRHAATRMQQRGIKAETVEILLVCGAEKHDHRGATIRYFDKQSRQRLHDRFGPGQLKRIEGQLDAYAVVDVEGLVLTVGHRTKRINRH